MGCNVSSLRKCGGAPQSTGPSSKAEPVSSKKGSTVEAAPVNESVGSTVEAAPVNESVEAPVVIEPEVPPEPTWNGVYLCYKPEAMGTLYLLWSKTHPRETPGTTFPENHTVLLYIEPGKAGAEHKYKTNCGRTELSKNVDDKKIFFQQLTSALQQTMRETKATQMHLVEQLPQCEYRICFLYHEGNKITKLVGPGDFNWKLSPTELNAVAVISFHEQSLDVQNLAEPLFMQFSQQAGGASVKLGRKSEVQSAAANITSELSVEGGSYPASSINGGRRSSGGVSTQRRVSVKITAMVNKLKSKAPTDMDSSDMEGAVVVATPPTSAGGKDLSGESKSPSAMSEKSVESPEIPVPKPKITVPEIEEETAPVEEVAEEAAPKEEQSPEEVVAEVVAEEGVAVVQEAEL